MPTFCSRLVVTCTLQDTPLPGSKAFTFATATPSLHIQQVGYPPSAELWRGRADQPLLASPTLDGRQVGFPSTNRRRITTPRWDARCPEHGPRGLCQPNGSWVNRPLGAPLSPPGPAASILAPPRVAKTRFLTPYHEPDSTSPEHLPPTSPASASQALAWAPPRAATSAPASPPRAWLPTRLHASIPRGARPAGFRLFA